MLFNQIKSAFRNLLRYKNYSVFNIAGLAAGIAVCILIAVIIRFETSFDDFHKNKDRLYRVLMEYHHPGENGIFYGAAAPFPLPTVIKKDFPDVKKSSGIFSFSDDQILVMDDHGKVVKRFKEKKGMFAVEPEFFDMFDFKWLAGNPTSSLSDKNSAVLTKEIAEKYFGDWKNALGKTIKIDNQLLVKVTGILENIPPNTDFQFKIVLPYAETGLDKYNDWGSSSDSHEMYLMLPPGATAATFDPRLREEFKKYRPADDKDEIVVQSLSEIHYYDAHSHLNNFLGRTIAKSSLRILWMIAAFILIIACVNFINLATAQAVNRAKEVGVRKVLGSGKWQLRWQFLAETFLLVLISVVIAVMIAAFAIPPVGRILEMPLSLSAMYSKEMILFFLALLFIVTLFAGFYPSVLLSGFNPIEALKSRLSIKSNKGISLRRSLVVFQFIIAQGLIICTIIMLLQMNYFNHQSMGFDKDNIVDITFPGDSASNAKIDYLKASLHGIPGVKNVSFNSQPPATPDNNWYDFKYDHALKYNEQYSIMKFVDPSYLQTYGLTLVAGRNFSSDTAHEVLINERMLSELGGAKNPEDVINKQIDIHDLVGPIVGVVQNFNSTGFKDKYSRVLFAPKKRYYQHVGVKLSSGESFEAIKSIENLWNKTFPDYVFEYQFMDEAVANFYKQESQLAALYKIFAAIAIFLGCLGLYGLASYMAAQRIKEVGIRKVLGASIGSIVYLFSKEFIVLISIAFLIASPIAWYFMHNWLQDYAFRINISWWIFVTGGFVSILVALATVSYRAIRAAIVNPVTSLRSE
jgi:putative ABC transport system permease protein